MTLLTVQVGVSSLKHETGFAMIELLFWSGPTDDVKILAVMLGVTASTVRFSGGQIGHACVIAFLCRNSFPNLGVAFKAFRLRSARSKRMTLSALKSSLQ
jgi:hypothetical protein